MEGLFPPTGNMRFYFEPRQMFLIRARLSLSVQMTREQRARCPDPEQRSWCANPDYQGSHPDSLPVNCTNPEFYSRLSNPDHYLQTGLIRSFIHYSYMPDLYLSCYDPELYLWFPNPDHHLSCTNPQLFHDILSRILTWAALIRNFIHETLTRILTNQTSFCCTLGRTSYHVIPNNMLFLQKVRKMLYFL